MMLCSRPHSGLGTLERNQFDTPIRCLVTFSRRAEVVAPRSGRPTHIDTHRRSLYTGGEERTTEPILSAICLPVSPYFSNRYL